MIFPNRKMFTIVLIGFFSCYALFCCCLTKTVEAKTTDVPTCHQTQHDNGKNSNQKDCDCDQTLAVVKAGEVHESIFQETVLLHFSKETFFPEPADFVALACQAPPDQNQTLSLFLKYSILRI